MYNRKITDHSLFPTMCSPCFLMICRASSLYLRLHKLFFFFRFLLFVFVTMFTYIPKKPALKCLLKARNISNVRKCSVLWCLVILTT